MSGRKSGGLLVAVTGGIATGKSTFSQMFAARADAVHFCADRAVADLLANDSEVRALVKSAFGEEAYHTDGSPDRGHLRSRVFDDDGPRRALEEILHPRVRARWMAIAEGCASGGRTFVADIPLLFETGVEEAFDAVVCVACSEEVRERRLLARPGIGIETAKKMIASQLGLGTKVERSHHVVWNDGCIDTLTAQADALACLFDARHGHS